MAIVSWVSGFVITRPSSPQIKRAENQERTLCRTLTPTIADRL